MIRSASLFLLASLLLASGCKQSSFLKQRYTHFGHAKPATTVAAKSAKPGLKDERPPPQLVLNRVPGAETSIPSSPMSTGSLPGAPASSDRAPQTNNGLVCSAGQARSNSRVLNKVKLVPVKIKKSQEKSAMGIPIISPILRLVLLILVIILVVLLIFALV